jgi:hypothetical protein
LWALCGAPGVRRDGLRARILVVVFVVHGTKKLLTRIGGPVQNAARGSDTALGDWYATALFWKPQIALFVNEPTLLPVLMPLAPASTLTTRFPEALADVLAAHGVSRSFIDDEVARMDDGQLATTKNRSVVGIMNEFTRLADTYRAASGDTDLTTLALRLARTPCGPLYDRHVSPDRELAALTTRHA